MTRFFTTASLIAVSLTAAQASADLVNHWTFDGLVTNDTVAPDTAGAVANDATWANVDGSGNTIGLAFDTPGISGGAARFGGGTASNRFFNISNGPDNSMEIDNATAMTISFWFNPSLNQDNNPAIIASRNSSVSRSGNTSITPDNQFWAVGWETNNKVRADSTGTTKSSELYDGSETQSEWFHVMWTWEGNGVAANDTTLLYINGVLDDDGSDPNADTYLSGDWIIGADPNGATNRNFRGLLDDLAVFDEALTAADALAIYNGGLNNGLNVAQVIPEPSSLALLGLGGLLIARRRRG